MVVAGALELAERRKDTITNPRLIVEVLSDSTKNYDRGEKFEFYRTIPSFQEYLLVDQAKIHLEHYTKTAHNQWLLTEYNELNSELNCVSIPFKIALSAIYKKVIL
jgi:Uma2 family endonuclease